MNQNNHQMSDEIKNSYNQNSGMTTQMKSNLLLRSGSYYKTAEMAYKKSIIRIFSRRRLISSNLKNKGGKL